MTETTRKAIEELGGMGVGQLRERYRAVFGEATSSGNRQWLLRRVAWRLQALEEGDLSERARRRAAELARDADLRVRPPAGPIVPPTASTAPARLLTVSGRVVRGADQRLPAPGTVLRREYEGKHHHVTVLTDGFEYDGRRYRSLSAVATAITGSHWNGFLWFGLAKAKESA